KGDAVVSDDREILESQVLAARRAVTPGVPPLPEDEMQRRVEDRMKRMIAGDPTTKDTPEQRKEIQRDLNDEYLTTYQSIAPAHATTYTFRGLERAKRENQGLSLRYK